MVQIICAWLKECDILHKSRTVSAQINEGKNKLVNCLEQWCFSLIQWADVLLYCVKWKNSSLTLAAGLPFQTSSSALFQSGYHTPMLVLDNTNFGIGKSSPPRPSLTCSIFLHVSFSCTLPHTYHVIQMKNVKGRPPGYSMPGQRKIFPSSSMRHSVQSVLCPTHISQLLDRHVLGWFQGSACCSAHWSPIQGNPHQPTQFCRCKKCWNIIVLLRWSLGEFIRGRKACFMYFPKRFCGE